MLEVPFIRSNKRKDEDEEEEEEEEEEQRKKSDSFVHHLNSIPSIIDTQRITAKGKKRKEIERKEKGKERKGKEIERNQRNL